MLDLESKLKLKNISNNIISIAIARHVLIDNIMELADREVDDTLSCKPLFMLLCSLLLIYYSAQHALVSNSQIPLSRFAYADRLRSRGNTVLTKTMELFMAWYGASFLEASVGSTIRRLCADKVAIEVDPVRSGKGAKSTEKSVELLVYWCQEFWTSIYDARTQCPL